MQSPGAGSLLALHRCARALRACVGQVTLISVESAAPAVTQAIRDHAKTCGAILGGPGVEPNRQASEIVRTMLDTPAPAVIDDGLLYFLPSLEAECRKSKFQPSLLPQAAEMAAILGCSEDEVNDDGLALPGALPTAAALWSWPKAKRASLPRRASESGCDAVARQDWESPEASTRSRASSALRASGAPSR